MKILISAGPTVEPIDDVRFISNHSSGRMGVALASKALAAGHEVTVVHGPLQVNPLSSGNWIAVKTTQDMLEALSIQVPSHDVVILSAAVCDMRPKRVEGKLDKQDLTTLEMEPTPDIAATIGENFPNIFKVVYSLESERKPERSLMKLKKKKANWVVCNELPSMGADQSQFCVLNKEGEEIVPYQAYTKNDFSQRFIKTLEKVLNHA